MDLSRYQKMKFSNPVDIKLGADGVSNYLARPYKRVESALMNHIKDSPRDNILLDLGCGVGCHTLRYAQMGFHVTGVDLSSNSIDHAKTINSHYRFQDGKTRFICDDILTHIISLPDNSIDVIIMHGVLYYLNVNDATREILRVLKPNGMLCFVETNGSNILLNLYRRTKHQLCGHRDLQTVNNLIKKKEFHNIASQFSSASIFYDGFFILVCGFLFKENRFFIKMLEGLDRGLLLMLQSLSFKVTVIAKK